MKIIGIDPGLSGGIAILENNLLEDGTIEIPEVIREYTKFDSIS